MNIYQYQLQDLKQYVVILLLQYIVKIQDIQYINYYTQKYIGKYAVNPITNREIPIIVDDILVDPKFGTGAVKVTPAHDYNDYDCGVRNNLKMINIMNKDGTLNENCSFLNKFDRFHARNEIVKYFKERSLY